MKHSIVRRAADEFARGNYLAALGHYRKLADTLGEANFHANILICQKRLRSFGRRDCTQLPLKEIRIAGVMDEFTFASYKDTCALLNLAIDNWELELDQFQPDLLFIESAWRGKDDAWNRKISQASPELIGIVDWCKKRRIPTMFWNKEDPVHYTTFLNTAKRFDYIFTTDIGCIANYKRDLEHDRVYLLPFACNPVEHNPVEEYERKPVACFAGSYYVRYPERIRDLDTLLGVFLDISGIEIYDRQYGKGDVNYAFPEKYASMILGNLKYEEIGIAYKGYAYGVNLNSVKYSFSMFARRVFELMASNTLVVSNYSKGVRLLFGELVIATDAEMELRPRIKNLIENPEYAEQVKLASVRKMMTEHTYEHRLSHLAEKVLGRRRDRLLPKIRVVAVACTQTEVDAIVRIFRSFVYEWKTLAVVIPSAGPVIPGGGTPNERVVLREAVETGDLDLGEDEFGAFVDAHNSYGRFYLDDLAIATKYAKAGVFAKGDFERLASTVARGRPPLGIPYSYGDSYYCDAALVSRSHWSELIGRVTSQEPCLYLPVCRNRNEVFFVDSFSFSPESSPEGGALPTAWHSNREFILDVGIRVDQLLQRSEAIEPSVEVELSTDKKVLYGTQLSEILDIQAAKRKRIECSVRGLQLLIDVREGAALPYYIYAKELLPVEDLWPDRSGNVFLGTTPGLELGPVFIFFDSQKNRIGHTISIANWNQTATIPLTASFVRLGIRVAGRPGQATVKRFVLDHASQDDQLAWVPTSKCLLISPNYPEYGDYYRYGFVHRRVKSYRDYGLKPDVFRFCSNGDLKLYEFEDVDVVSGSAGVLNTVLSSGDYAVMGIHAPDATIWEVVSSYIEGKKVVAWLHGAEIQSWRRRAFNYLTPGDLESARIKGERRDEFWRMLFGLRHPNIHFVFVSNHFRREVVSDLGVDILPENVHIIPNPIDTKLFRYVRKDPEQRKRILSIRPYASRVYANDLSVKAIMELSARPYFAELRFLLVGDGVLFEETVAPLRDFGNVEIRKGFVSQAEIASLHQEYGVFLCPSRMDSQGVSRDEAMASGLVPVTTDVGAIGEFVQDGCGFLCMEESYTELADAISALYYDPERFEAMSERAASLVRQSRSAEHICKLELELLQA